MTASWSFNKADPSDVEIEITQRDQFINEEVGLNQSLVREVIQNSLDARAGKEPVNVCFSIQNLSEIGDHAVEMLRDNIKPLRPHFKACNVPIPSEKTSRVLVIQDFSTKGLTGSIDQKINGEDYTDFYRVVGKSKKRGQHGGRWGLGKLVFSSSSRIRTFYGVTRRDGDSTPYAMGQVILESHEVDGVSYRSHGFWHDGRSKPDNIQMPTTDEDDLKFLETISRTQRREQSGLTIIIPHVHQSIGLDAITQSVLNNYYFPIISGQLSVEVGNRRNFVTINSKTFEQTIESSGLDSRLIPVSFLTEVNRRVNDSKSAVKARLLDSSRFSKENLEDGQVNLLKQRFNDGILLHVIVPIRLARKGGERECGKFHLFLQSVKDEPTFSFFARGPILLTAENLKVSGQVRAGIVAEYGDVISEFLGDAEHPSHTRLNSSATKLAARWEPRPASSAISAIRNSLKGLFDIVVEQDDTIDSDALSKFFSIVETQKVRKGKKSRKPDGAVEGEGGTAEPGTSPNPVGFVIAKNPDGFILISTKDAENWDLRKPKTIRVSMAYDMVSGDSLAFYSEYDFNLYDPETISVDSDGGSHYADDTNVLIFSVEEPVFKLSVTLPDLNRDLFVSGELVE